MDLCEQSTWRPGERVSRWWWDQAGIDLEGAKKRAAEEATVLESELDSDLNADLGGEEESTPTPRPLLPLPPFSSPPPSRCQPAITTAETPFLPAS